MTPASFDEDGPNLNTGVNVSIIFYFVSNKFIAISLIDPELKLMHKKTQRYVYIYIDISWGKAVRECKYT